MVTAVFVLCAPESRGNQTLRLVDRPDQGSCPGREIQFHGDAKILPSLSRTWPAATLSLNVLCLPPSSQMMPVRMLISWTMPSKTRWSAGPPIEVRFAVPNLSAKISAVFQPGDNDRYAASRAPPPAVHQSKDHFAASVQVRRRRIHQNEVPASAPARTRKIPVSYHWSGQ
jgi:hypothetical protein